MTKIKVETAMDFKNDLADVRAGRSKKGLSTGWKEFDQYYRIADGQLNVVSGYPASGKSEWVDSIMVSQSSIVGTSVCYYSPENWPSSILVQKLIEKKAKQELSKISQKEYDEHLIWVQLKFHFITSDDGASIENILMETARLIKEGKTIKHLVIDPWNECDSTRPSGMSETDYIGLWLMNCRRFARKYKINIWIVCHPAKPQKDKNGKIFPPSIYDLAGSAHWFNKADNAFIVHRENKETNLMIVFIRKIKNRYFGKVGSLDFEFIWRGGNFKVASQEDIQEGARVYQQVPKEKAGNDFIADKNKKRLDKTKKMWDDYREVQI